jgi:sugar lactone lactonase YvrE
MNSKLAAVMTLCMFHAGCIGVGEEAPVAVSADAGAAVDGARGSDPFTDPSSASPVRGAGVITLAGSEERGLVDGSGAIARFNNPTNVVLGPDGNLYVADYDNGDVRLVRPNGMTLTLTRQEGFSHPFGMAFGADGALYVETDSDDAGDRTNGMIWLIDRRTGVGTILARNLGRPRGLLVLPDGRLVMVDNEHHVVRLLDPATRAITDLAGVRDAAGLADGRGADARFDHPYDVVLTPDQRLVVADQNNHLLRAITLDGVVSTYAGTGLPGSTDGTQATATFNSPQALAIDADGNIFVTDIGGYVVRRVAVDGTVSTIAGVGRAGFADGEPMQAQFFGLEGIDVSRNGRDLFVADGNRGGAEPSHRIRRIELPSDKN